MAAGIRAEARRRARSNIGVPANPQLPYYLEDRPDALGYVANSAGRSYVDGGVECIAMLSIYCSLLLRSRV